MPRTYTVEMANQSVSGAITLVQIKPGIASCEIERVKLTQSSSTSSAMQDVAMGTTTTAATVTSKTPNPHDLDDAAAKAVGGTSATGVNASVEGSTQTDIIRDSFNILTGFEWVATPEERIHIPGGGGTQFYVRLPAAPGSTTTFNCRVTFRENG